jgi:ubiquinone/menaquinone biosynthesis C-methylase UbiE
MATDRIIDLIRGCAQKLRLRRMQQFLRVIKPSSKEIILDIGGYPELWVECEYRGRIVFLNLEKQEEYRTIPGNCSYIQGDGRHLDFPEKSFDIVFSNSVIEHVGGWKDQKAFADETSRVGKRYWIQTPNKNFPVEPHYNFPLFQFFPVKIREQIAVFWPYSFIKRNEGKNVTRKELKEFVRRIRLLTNKELQTLYPDGKLWQERLFGLVKSIVVYRC